MTKRNLTIVVVCVCLVLCAGIASAGMTGKLMGTALDDKGAALPGVTVTIASPALMGGAHTAATESNGTFSFPSLPPGFYTVKFELASFLTQERTEVQVRLDHTTEIAVRMPLSKYGEAITVTADTPVVDPAQTGTGQTFTPDFLNRMAVGSANRGYQDVLSQAAGAVQDNGNPHVFGSTLGENSYLIDGLETTDPVTATFGTNFAFDAIQEISFQTGGFEAEYGRATGGVVNVVTKSGGNDFSGTFDLRYHTQRFYQSGTHYDTSTQRVKYLDPALTFGGPIVKDRVWFFVSGENIDSQTTPFDSPTTRKFAGKYYLGKVTWQVDQNWRLAAKVSGDPTNIDNDNASQFNTPEANDFQKQGSKIYQAEMSSVLSPRLLWNAQVGYYRSTLNVYPESGDLSAVAHQNAYTGYDYGSYSNAQYSNRNRDDYNTNMTWFVENFGGSHEFKGGIEYNKLDFADANFNTGNGYYYEDSYDPASQANIPYLMWYQGNIGTQNFTGKNETGYVQDAWRPTKNLTLKIGVRYDTVSFKNDVDTTVADMNKLQPRIGFAWDLTGDATNMVSGSWGRFMHPSALTLPTNARVNSLPDEAFLSCGYFLGFTSPAACQAWVAARAAKGYQWSAGPNDWDPAGWILTPSNIYSSQPSQIASGLKPTYADEWSLGFERQIANRTSLGVTYIKKETKNIFEDTCNGNIPTPTAGGDCSYYIMSNLPGLRRDYEGVVINFESRATDWFHLLANYTWSKSQGNVEYDQNAGSDFDIYPYLWQNRYGYLSDDRRHRVKVSGYFLLPYQFTVGFTGFWSSAFAYDLLTNNADPDYANLAYGDVYLAPRGSFRANSNYQFDMQISKGFKFSGINVQLIAAITNVFNSQRPTGVCEYKLGCGNYAWGQPDAWQIPRQYEAGFRIEF